MALCKCFRACKWIYYITFVIVLFSFFFYPFFFFGYIFKFKKITMYLSTQILMHFYSIKSQEYSLIMGVVCYYGVEF